ncbi:MAG: tautomerase family protein [Clostridia bacterium]|nr:tautomerase family protein [Clostridia bacterium]
MPHISIKMLEGRTEEQKQGAANALAKAICTQLGVSEKFVSVTVEEYSAEQWQYVYKKEIADKKDKLYFSPKYKAEDLL